MNAKKCDRCGKYYCGGDTASVTLTNGVNNFARTMFKWDLNPKEKSYDLCENRIEEFNKWMNPDDVDAEKVVNEIHETE